ncbi:hypothetical protein FRB99_005849 [Tulasnella sp. 403]|nr:hypothetical protein FRB99_005849 [Tulasnella sp. 403]
MVPILPEPRTRSPSNTRVPLHLDIPQSEPHLPTSDSRDSSISRPTYSRRQSLSRSQRSPALPSFSLIGALEFRDVVNSLQRESTSSALNTFDEPSTSYKRHYKRPSFGSRSNRSRLESWHAREHSQDEVDPWDAALAQANASSDVAPSHHGQATPYTDRRDPEPVVAPPPIPSIAILPPDSQFVPSSSTGQIRLPSSPSSPSSTINEILISGHESTKRRWTPFAHYPSLSNVLSTLFPTLLQFTSSNRSFIGRIISILAAPAVLLLTLSLPVVIVSNDEGERLKKETQVEIHMEPADPEAYGNNFAERIQPATEEELERDAESEVSSIMNDLEKEMHPEGFAKWLLATQCIAGPLFVTAALFSRVRFFWIMLLVAFVVGVSSAVLVCVFAKDGRNPLGRICRSLMGFTVAVVWIMAIADEVVRVLQTFGFIFGLSDAIIGLTVFAIGNSLADFVANLSVAAFAPIMGFSACFGGPMLNMLLGVGISGSVVLRQNKQSYYPIDFSSTLLVSSIGLLSLLIMTLTFVPYNGYFLPRRWGFFLIFYYVKIFRLSVMADVVGPAAAALASLSETQVSFIQNLPKAELHAHLNGSIPITTLQKLANERPRNLQPSLDNDPEEVDIVQAGLDVLRRGVQLTAISDFFGLFPAIYSLTSNPTALRQAAADVLNAFLDPQEIGGVVIPAECAYLELRSTPRQTSQMTRKEYVEAVLDEVEKYPADQAALIVSVDRRMSVQEAHECVDLAIALNEAGRRIVGVDLCGDPCAGDMKEFLSAFQKVKEAGLGLTLHIAEVNEPDIAPDTDTLLSADPSRLGHATFLTAEEQVLVNQKKIPIEICLTSNLLCKTVASLDDHHVRWYLQAGHPVAICTDDTLPFRTSMTAEYALLMAEPPLGLGLTTDEMKEIAAMGMNMPNEVVLSFQYRPRRWAGSIADDPDTSKSTIMSTPSRIIGCKPSSPQLGDYLKSLAPSLDPPEVKAYPDAVYFNYYGLGISLLFTPTAGYIPKSGADRKDLDDNRLVLESIDVYNPAESSPQSGREDKPSTRAYSAYPKYPIKLVKNQQGSSVSADDLQGGDSNILAVDSKTTGKDFVAFLGEPSRKGGGSGPAGGSIGIWCEWKDAGVMVEFGGADAKGAKAWETGKDAKWAVLTLFAVTKLDST